MYSTLGHLLMMQDARRIEAYARAIRSTVKAGDVVLDLGCGAGVMTFLALEAGASHVYAIEPSEAIHLAEMVALRNGISDVTFIKADARDVDLAGGVDVILADLRGALPILGDSLQVVDAVRARHLRPGGQMVPQTDRIYVAPIEDVRAHAAVRDWKRHWGIANFGCLSTIAANHMRRFQFSEDSLLSPSTAMTPEVDYRAPAEKEFSIATECIVSRRGSCHGLAAWFEANLCEGVTFSTSPSAPPAVYGQAYFPIEVAIDVNEGDVLKFELRGRFVGNEPVWTWTVSRQIPAKTSERHSSLRGKVLSGDDLQLRAADHVPALSTDGEIDREILNLMTGQRSNREIALEILARFPSFMRTPQDALSRVGTLALRYRATKRIVAKK